MVNPSDIQKGKFIVVDGVDGSGKSSMIPFIKTFLEGQGVKEVVTTREPGGCLVSEKIRSLILHEDLSPTSQALLAWAAREEHLRQTILPALNRGAWVVSDRFSDSTFAYQGNCVDWTGLSETMMSLLQIHVQRELDKGDPDLILIFDAPYDITSERRKTRDGSLQNKDVFERKSIEFFEKAREEFVDPLLFTDDYKPYHLIDASGTVIQARHQVAEALLTLLASDKRWEKG